MNIAHLKLICQTAKDGEFALQIVGKDMRFMAAFPPAEMVAFCLCVEAADAWFGLTPAGDAAQAEADYRAKRARLAEQQ